MMLRSFPHCRAYRSLLGPSASLLAAKSLNRTLSTSTTNVVYEGPLSKTFRRLKIFSLSSLSLSVALTPFIFTVESSLPFQARCTLAGIALLTSGVSTVMIGWCGHSYVATLKPLEGAGGVEMTTSTIALRKRITRVYDTAFLVETSRPFAKWQLTDRLQQAKDKIAAGTEETVAETTDGKGRLVGRWVVKWDENGHGTCREVGKINKYFNVHEELLPFSIR